MTRARALSPTLAFLRLATRTLSTVLVIAAADCTRSESTSPASATLRVGGLPQQAQQAGLRPLVANLLHEGLAVPYEDGRLRPWLAESWTTSTDGLVVDLSLRRTARFHDG